jgi:putative Holliday junction resolvase
MARILGIDYGSKRCGIAVTDPLQIIVTGLDTVETDRLFAFLENYISKESVEKMVVGLPVHKDGNFTYLKENIERFVKQFSIRWPLIAVDYGDEQFSSKHARQIIFDSGVGKRKRQDKALIDKVSAVVILQRYLKHI